MQTEPPEKLNFCAQLNQWTIYDKYQRYEAAKERAEELEAKKDDRKIRRRLMETTTENSAEEEKRKMLRCSQILERMVNQNNCYDISVGRYCRYTGCYKTSGQLCKPICD